MEFQSSTSAVCKEDHEQKKHHPRSKKTHTSNKYRGYTSYTQTPENEYVVKGHDSHSFVFFSQSSLW